MIFDIVSRGIKGRLGEWLMARLLRRAFPLGKSWAFLRNLRVGDEWGILSVFQGVLKAVKQMADELGGSLLDPGKRACLGFM